MVTAEAGTDQVRQGVMERQFFRAGPRIPPGVSAVTRDMGRGSWREPKRQPQAARYDRRDADRRSDRACCFCCGILDAWQGKKKNPLLDYIARLFPE